MKVITIFFLAMHYTYAQSAALSAEAQCGELGVFEYNVSDLPEGITPSKVRTCREHPRSLLEKRSVLEKRECLKPDDDRIGCSKDGWACGRKVSVWIAAGTSLS
ncbi:hypothetical protein GRF29_161g1419466 [Pseudopithomyces chartarum]|uniref:Uncharacterized protein n=1 Tax=Pseudopithomyces chartarum TaxID=1892770 RepID=A0AAN6LQA9_9PLEO|nr:hypothetical protein GRF29_161g1419466 [Pseudopithomyces chartarum]